MNVEPQLRSPYVAFNARDIDGVLAAMTEDVDWTNAWEGGRLHGREGSAAGSGRTLAAA
jgi:ketosteroid isomerase-like protein